MFWKFRRKSELSTPTVKHACNLQDNPLDIQDSNTPEHNRRQHDSHVACVMAQQCSSATLVSLHFHSRNVKFSARFKSAVIVLFFYILELRKSKTVKLEIA
jgi:hypothetical protein